MKELTITKLARFISAHLTNSEIEEILLEAGDSESCRDCNEPISVYRKNNPQFSSKEKRLKNVFLYYSKQTWYDGSYYYCLLEIINAFYTKIHDFKTTDEGKEILKRLHDDGIEIERLGIKKELYDSFDLPEKISLIREKLTDYNLEISLHHIDEALSSYKLGNYASANSQIRTFFGAFFQEIMKKLQRDCEGEGDCRKKFLEFFLKPVLDEKEFKAIDNMLTGFSKFLHSKGSHPGIPDKATTEFRLTVAVAWVLYTLELLKNKI
ncbi:hypothetical protein [Balnearium lithotrophicum]|nr:hypothetical protein [Balnearium lithotrophicum]